MIAHISGTVASRSLQSVVVDVGGVGFEVIATPDTLATCHEGSDVHLITQLIVREDSQTLYGFTTTDERDVFNILITAPGIGPKVALAVLSIFQPDQLRLAIANEDEGALTQVPGIGKKTAKQMIANIGNRLGEPTAPVESTAQLVDAPVQATKIVDALENLGWNSSQARKAVATAEAQKPEATEGELLRLSLQILGGQHGA